jgi:hypothetical protein
MSRVEIETAHVRLLVESVRGFPLSIIRHQRFIHLLSAAGKTTSLVTKLLWDIP